MKKTSALAWQKTEQYRIEKRLYLDCQVENKLTFTVSVVLAEGIKNTLKAEPGMAASMNVYTVCIIVYM